MVNEVKHRLLSGALWAFGGKLLSVLFGFLINLMLARNMAVDQYGAYFVILNTIIVTASMGTLGVDQVVVRFVAAALGIGAQSVARLVIIKCLVVAALGGLASGVALYAVTPWLFGSLMKMSVAVPLAALLMIWSVASTIQRQLAESFRGLNDIRFATLFGGLRSNGAIICIIMLVAVAISSLRGRIDLRDVVMMSIWSAFCVALLAALTLKGRLKVFTSNASPGASEELGFGRAIHEGWPIWIAIGITMLREQGVGWFAGAFDSAEHVALFGVAQRFVLLITIPLFVINTVLPPLVADLYAKGETSRMERVVRTVSGLASLPCLAALAILALTGQPILRVLFGEFYESSYPLMLILSIGYLADILTGSWQVVLPMTGLRRQTIRVSVCAGVAQFAACLVGGHLAGVYGVAIGLMIGMLVGNLYGVFLVRRHLGIWTVVSIRKNDLIDAAAMLGRRFPLIGFRRS